MRKAIIKLKNRMGFTLAETMMTVLILVMVAGVVAGGIPVAANAYTRAVDGANAQLLLSTTVNALRNEISTAKDLHFNAQGEPVYISPATGSKTKIYKSDNNTIMVQDFLRYDEQGPQTDGKNGEEIKARPLVSKSTETKNLLVTFDSVEKVKEGELIVFKGLAVIKKETDDPKPIATIDELYIRCLGVKLTQ